MNLKLILYETARNLPGHTLGALIAHLVILLII